MESALHQRDHIGVQDSVLLENHESEDAFIENLRKRFKANLIYVSLPYVVKSGLPRLKELSCDCVYIYIHR